MAQVVKRLSVMWETRFRSLGQEDPLQKEMATHSSTLTWKIPWMEEPGGLQSMGSQSQTQLGDFTLNFSYIRSLVAQMVVSSCNSGDPGLIPGLERPPGEENGYALQYSYMEFHGQRRLTGYSPWDFGVRHNWATNTFLVIYYNCFPGGSVGKDSSWNAGDCLQCRRTGFNLRKTSWRRKWQPSPVFLPGKSRGQRHLTGYSPWDFKGSDMTWATDIFLFIDYNNIPKYYKLQYVKALLSNSEAR